MLGVPHYQRVGSNCEDHNTKDQEQERKRKRAKLNYAKTNFPWIAGIVADGVVRPRRIQPSQIRRGLGECVGGVNRGSLGGVLPAARLVPKLNFRCVNMRWHSALGEGNLQVFLDSATDYHAISARPNIPDNVKLAAGPDSRQYQRHTYEESHYILADQISLAIFYVHRIIVLGRTMILAAHLHD